MPVESFQNAVPIEFAGSQPLQVDVDPVKNWILQQRNYLQSFRSEKKTFQDECWALFRGESHTGDKEDWQSQVTLPKAFNSVKQATNAITRLLRASEQPWQIDPINPDDLVMAARGQQMADLVRLFLELAGFLRPFAEGLESGFIGNIGVWRLWWGMQSRMRITTQQAQGPDGRPQQQVVREQIDEGRLFMRAVDPYRFYWLPGSRFNQWTGTIEEYEIPKYQLIQLAERGVFDAQGGIAEVMKLEEGRTVDQSEDQAHLRFKEPISIARAQGRGIGSIKITEYYGPVMGTDGRAVELNGHIVIANDTKPLLAQKNELWSQKPPYVAFSPLQIPFRVDGIGIVEMTREVDKAMNQLVQMGMDKLLFNLLPMFEGFTDAYENPEDLETGMTPGKILRRDRAGQGLEGLTPVQMQDLSPGTLQMYGLLDRGHQEGAFISEIMQSLPRFRGAQTATEVDTKADFQQDFLGSLADSIDEFALKPIVELAMELVVQYLDTARDARVGSILGVGAARLQSMTQPQLVELVTGDYIVKVTGITDQVQKAEQLQGLIQFMNIIGQSEEWGPYLDRSQLLHRVLEAFRGTIRDIDNIVHDPATVEANRIQLQNSALTPELLRMMPQFVQIAAELQRNGPGALDAAAEGAQGQVQAMLGQEQQASRQAQMQQAQVADLQYRATIAELEARIAEAERIKAGKPPAAKGGTSNT